MTAGDVRFQDPRGHRPPLQYFHSFMRLEKLYIHRFISLLRWMIPFVVLLLAAVPVWNYLKQRSVRPLQPQQAKELLRDLAVRTEGFTFSRTERGKTLFTIRASTNLGFKDNKNMLEDVDVTVYGKTEDEPVRRIHSKFCSYDQQSNDIRFEGDVEVQLDDKTWVRGPELTYDHRNRVVSSSMKTMIQQKDSVEGHADSLEYGLDSRLLKLTGNVDVRAENQMALQAGSALFQQNENWASTDGGVFIRSGNGWVKGTTGHADLEPGTFKPRKIVVEGEVSAESQSQNGQESWKLRAAQVEALISTAGNIDRVNARGNVDVQKSSANSKQQLRGGLVTASFFTDGKVNLLEAHENARMNFGSDGTLQSNHIFTNSAGAVQTTDESVLHIGESTIEGREFTIQQGEVVSFSTTEHANLKTGEKSTSADRTEARFNSRTNSLMELVQTGNFQFRERERQGHARNARFEDDGNVVTLDGASAITDPQMYLQAGQIRMNQKDNSFSAAGDVKTVTKNSGEPVLVTAGHAEGKGDSIVYTNGVQLWRGNAYIKANRLQASSQDNSLGAEGKVQSNIETIRAVSDRLDYDDRQRVAHYMGAVRAQKQDMVLHAGDMNVKLNENDVDEIIATGNVLVEQDARRGSGERATYKASTGVVVLTGPTAEVRDPERGTVHGTSLTMKTSGETAAVEGAPNARSITKHPVKK